MSTNNISNRGKQKDVFVFIKNYISQKGYPPSVREICVGVDLKSTSTVHGHIESLIKKGLLKKDPTKPRTLELTDKKELITIPIVGTVTAGAPILAVENIQNEFVLPIEFTKSNEELFMLKIKGDSMIECGIMDGDLVIVQKQETAKNGDIVVALIENDATVKRFFKEENHIRLQPENKRLKPIIVDDCSILGVLIGLYRKL
ncbi:MAG: transcriptional repressor LexA [Oscillospiraceae bacterium]|nr:transcriptional repressor LexA [Oscillospiraceae bacterium]